jgi:hypothetical protein
MKKSTFLLASMLFVSTITFAQEVKTPAPSPTQTIKQDFALSSIEINYSRPNTKGRTIFGDLVPYGKLWRTGANGVSKITFGEDVKFGGVPVKAGTYALYTIPGQSEWEVILNEGLDNWGVDGYKATDDVAKFKVKSMNTGFNTDSFTMQIGKITSNSAEIALVWEKTAIIMPVTADIDTKIMADIEKAMNVDSKPYFTAASYYFENGKDMNKALAWANKAVDAQPKAFWVMLLKAKIQQKLGDKMGAMATSKMSAEIAKAAGNMDYVALNEKLQASMK